jgi:hypothetical protein
MLGTASAVMIAMMSTTTAISISVKPACALSRLEFVEFTFISKQAASQAPCPTSTARSVR